MSLIQSIDSDTSFDANDNKSIEDNQPQKSELLTEFDSKSDNDDENSSDKSGVEWSLQTDTFNTSRIPIINILKVKPEATSYAIFKNTKTYQVHCNCNRYGKVH